MRVQRKSKKPYILIAIVIATVVAGLAWYYATSNSSTEDVQETSSQEKGRSVTSQENKGRDDSDLATDKNTGQSVEHEREKELPQLYEGDNANKSTDLTGVITTKSVTGGNLIIRNTINQLVGTGSCKLTLTSSGQTITRSVEIAQNPSSSTCAGFDIPVAEIGQGQWSIQIDITSGDKRATLKDTVNIQL